MKKSLESIQSKPQQKTPRKGTATTQRNTTNRSEINASKLSKTVPSEPTPALRKNPPKVTTVKPKPKPNDKKLSRDLLGNQEAPPALPSTKTNRLKPALGGVTPRRLSITKPVRKPSQISDRLDFSVKKTVSSRQTSGVSVKVLPWRAGSVTSNTNNNKSTVSISSMARQSKNKSNLSLSDSPLDYNKKITAIEDQMGTDVSYSRIDLIPQNTLLSTNFGDSRNVKHSTARDGSVVPLNRLDWSALQRRATEVNGKVDAGGSDEEDSENTTSDLIRKSELKNASGQADEGAEKTLVDDQLNCEKSLSILNSSNASRRDDSGERENCDDIRSLKSGLDHLQEEKSSGDRSQVAEEPDGEGEDKAVSEGNLGDEKTGENELNDDTGSRKSLEGFDEDKALSEACSEHQESDFDEQKDDKSQLNHLDDKNDIECFETQSNNADEEKNESDDREKQSDNDADIKSMKGSLYAEKTHTATPLVDSNEEKSQLEKSLISQNSDVELEANNNNSDDNLDPFFDESIDHFGDKGLSRTQISFKSSKEARIASSRAPYKLDKLPTSLRTGNLVAKSAESQHVEGVLDYSSVIDVKAEDRDRVGLSAMDGNRTYESDWIVERENTGLRTPLVLNSKSKSDLKAIKDRKNEILKNLLMTENSEALLKDDILTFISENTDLNDYDE